MAFDAGTVVANLVLNSGQFKDGISGAVRNLQDLVNGGNTTNEKMKGLGAGLSGVGKAMTMGLTLPIVGVGAASVKMANDFGAQMSRVQALSGATGDEFSQLRQQALDLGATTAFSASEAALGMENLASAGFTVTEITAAMPGMLDLAAASGEDLGVASDIAASTLRGFGLEATEAGRVANVLAQASASTNAGVADLGDTMKYVAPVANAMGLSLEEVTAAAGIMANAGIKGGEAGTALRASLLRLANPSKEAAGTLKELGFNAFDSNGKMLPLKDMIERLQGSMAGLTDQQKSAALATIFGQEAVSGMLTLVKAGPDELAKLTQGLQGSEGAAKNMADTMLNNTKGSIDSMMGAIETAAIKIGDALAPAIESVANVIGGLAEKFSNLSPTAQTTILVVAGIIAAIGPLLVIVGQLIIAITAISGAIAAAGGIMAIITGPIGITIAAIAALIAVGVLLYKNWDTIKATAISVWTSISTFFSELWTGIVTGVTNAWSSITSFFSNLWLTITTGITTAWNSITAFFSNLWLTITTAFTTAWTGITTFFTNLWNGIVLFIMGIWNGIVTFLTTTWNNIVANTAGIWEGIKMIFESVWGIIKNIFLGAMLVIMDIITGDFGAIKGHISQIWDNIKGYFGTIWDGIKLIFTTYLNILKNAVNIIFTTIGNFIKNTWEGIKSTSATLWENIKTGLSNALNAIKTFFTNTFTAIKTFISTTWDNIKTTCVNAPNAIKTSVTNTFNAIKTFFFTTWENIKTNFSNAWNNLKSIITNAGPSIKSAVTNIGNSILNTLKGINLYEIGTNIIQGLINGIKAMIGKAASVVGDLADTIKGKIKGALGIHSPSKVMEEEVGRWIPEGVAKGIQGNTGAIETASAKMKTVALKEASISKTSGVSEAPANNVNTLKVHIENFVNNTDKDIETLAYELEFYRNKLSLGRSGY